MVEISFSTTHFLLEDLIEQKNVNCFLGQPILGGMYFGPQILFYSSGGFLIYLCKLKKKESGLKSFRHKYSHNISESLLKCMKLVEISFSTEISFLF